MRNGIAGVVLFVSAYAPRIMENDGIENVFENNE